MALPLKQNFLGLKRDFPFYATPHGDILVINDKEKFSYGSNSCRHMGMKLLDHSSDCVVRCPYHGMDFIPESSLTEIGQFLFLPNTFPSIAQNPLKEISDDMGEEMQRLYNAGPFPWWLWMQNTMDPNHLPHVHKDGFYELFKPDGLFATCTEGTYSSHYWKVKPEVVERFKRHCNGTYGDNFFHMTLFPNLSITSFLGCIYSVESVVEESGESRVLTRYFASKKRAPDLVLRKASKFGHEKILKEDVDICSKLAESYVRPSFFLPGEERIKHFLSWVFGDNAH